MKPVSIILTHWAQNDFRSATLADSLGSVIETTKHLPVEIIVVDNGANPSDSQFLLNLAQEKKIQFYVRNSENLYFGHGRNEGVWLSCGEYLAFSDNDIKYENGWLERCIDILEEFPDKKLAATPLRTDRQHRNFGHWSGELDFRGERILLNMRAGSNSWVMRREDFFDVGLFRNHHVAGSKWSDAFVKKGYLMATMEKNPLAKDIGFKKGYNIQYQAVIKRVFANGEELIINN